jgi:hypothetical protein
VNLSLFSSVREETICKHKICVIHACFHTHIQSKMLFEWKFLKDFDVVTDDGLVRHADAHAHTVITL